MNTSINSSLTIVIPAKNERRLLPKLLQSLCNQDYAEMRRTKVFVADAGSTDGTADIALSFRDRLDIEVIPGGLPSVGRNKGAERATSEFLLFLDADMELRDKTLIRRTIELAKRRKLDCVTTNICCEGTAKDQIAYLINNLTQWLSIFVAPFSTGMFMLFRRERFWELGGFHEHAMYAEDYLLSKRVQRRKFRVLTGKVHTTNRRFRNMGYWRVCRMFVMTALNTWNDNYFLKDRGYWDVQLTK
ncbi:MAG: glycosyltransferase [Acidobacteriales bacterium]|nr:glycosyltransferase [Terriglobales bacterium]